MPGGLGSEEHRVRGAGTKGSKGAREQGSKGAREQGSKGARMQVLKAGCPMLESGVSESDEM
ncbi:MAG: hypothetical protein FJ149_00270 [Euryarchaeota archaeon]|nr:hypothetical protein [Euryarchaeota archaeon]